MDLCNQSCSSGQSAILHGKNFILAHYRQTFQQNSLLPAMFVSTIDFNHFIPLPVTLTLDSGSQDQHKPKPVAFIFLHTFLLIKMKFDMVLKQFKLNILIIL